MDKLDLQIAERLQKDATATNSKIAKDVGVSEETVRRRLKTLKSESMIEIVAVPNAGKLGFESRVLVGVQVDNAKVDGVADRIKEMPQVTRLIITTGAYDMFAWASLKSMDDLSDFLRLDIGKIEGVRRTETFMVLSVEKEQFGVNMKAILDERYGANSNSNSS